MADRWQLQEAKSHFSEVVDRALDRGPQIITRHGQDTAVVLSTEEYQRLQLLRQPLGDFLKSSPLAGSNLDLQRSKEPARKDEVR